MNHVARRTMTPEEFLEWEAGQDRKWEFDGFEPVAMAGGTDAHAAVCGNLITALTVRLRGKSCRPRGTDLKVRIGSSYRYPDGLVYCTPNQPTSTFAPDPVVVFEVLSDSTAADDRTVKSAEYRSLPSLMHYVLLEQDRVFITIVSRTDDGWRYALMGPDGVMALPEIGIELPVAELYEGLELSTPYSEPGAAS